MDNRTTKEFILRRVFFEFIPNIIGNYQILSPERDSWYPNFYLLDEYQRPSSNISISITLNENLKFLKCEMTIQENAHGELVAFRRLVGGVEPPLPQTQTFLFENKNTVIKELCDILEIDFIIRLGTLAMLELNQQEDPSCFGVGTIKKILGLSPDVDLRNLETRKVLLEFSK